MKNLTFVICSNGYGHYKRVFKVLNEIQKRRLDLNITIICNKKNLDFIKNNFGLNIESVFFFTDLMVNEPNWISLKGLTISSYLNWVEGFKSCENINRSSLIVSDNYLAPLISGKKCILMGSFLWHEVIKDYNQDIRKISENEKGILKYNKPKMIVLENMFIDSLEENASLIKTSWFAERKTNLNYLKNNKILITSGGTTHLDDIFLEIVNVISRKNQFKDFYLDSKLFKKHSMICNLNLNNVFEFNFQEKSFSMIDTIICRPGIGILTDSMSFMIPTIVIFDDQNSEIRNNAYKIDQFGLGFKVKVNNAILKKNDLDKIHKIINSKEKLDLCKEKISKQKMNGHKVAADIIINEILT